MTKKYSKFMSLILRHNPQAGNIQLDGEGWAVVDDVLFALETKVGPITRTQLNQLVAENDKKRFAFNPAGDKIRASQGHSVLVDLNLDRSIPPPRLYHGTKQRFLKLIMNEGLLPMKRQHVHLSATIDTADVVAQRRAGDSVILTVETKSCPQPFFLSENGIWLTNIVPPDAISIYHTE